MTLSVLIIHQNDSQNLGKCYAYDFIIKDMNWDQPKEDA